MTANTGRAVLILPADTQIRITREFDAPRALVWKAWTTPELIKRWWHAKRGTATVADVDLKAGGRWRWVMVTRDGREVAFHGQYREVAPPERLVYTEVFEGAPGADDRPVVVTVTFTERDGRTTATMLMDAPSREVRDMIVESGMEGGLQDALELLEGVAQSLA